MSGTRVDACWVGITTLLARLCSCWCLATLQRGAVAKGSWGSSPPHRNRVTDSLSSDALLAGDITAFRTRWGIHPARSPAWCRGPRPRPECSPGPCGGDDSDYFLGARASGSRHAPFSRTDKNAVVPVPAVWAPRSAY